MIFSFQEIFPRFNKACITSFTQRYLLQILENRYTIGMSFNKNARSFVVGFILILVVSFAILFIANIYEKSPDVVNPVNTFQGN